MMRQEFSPHRSAALRDRQPSRCREEDYLGSNCLGRPMVHIAGYAYVHQSIAEQFVAECKRAITDLYGSEPKDNPNYSRIISADAVRRLASISRKWWSRPPSPLSGRS